MRKAEFWKKSYIDEKDEREKETYLKELGYSVHNYIKTGVKNRQLEAWSDLEEQFFQKYEERFVTEKIAEQISEFSKDSLIELVKECKEKLTDAAISADKLYDLQWVETSDKIYRIMVEKVSCTLNEVIRDTAYLSHMNMLYELYEKEEQLRREKEEYDRISEKYQKMADVLKNLSKQRHMELEQLQKQTNIPQKELEKLLGQYSKFFNMRPKLDGIQISLSPSGKKFFDHVMDVQEKFSRESVNQLIYKNCDAIMESLENSYEGGIEYELKLENLSPEREHALQSKYHGIAQKVISDREEMYHPLSCHYVMIKEKESMFKNNEENRFTIPRNWDYDNN
ncbi:MAG: hypothetical protein HFI69_04705 [Lachnospiraceae bacterium]|nr:hypothetical protein [Lachnospiraceae bacterium]